MPASACGQTDEKGGRTPTNAAEAAAGKEISLTEVADVTTGKKKGLTIGTDGARPMRAELEPGTETGAALPAQPLGGSSREMKPDPGPESCDPAKRRAEDVGTSDPGALQGV